jgi:hypothetical protein
MTTNYEDTIETECKVCGIWKDRREMMTYSVCEDCAEAETLKVFDISKEHIRRFVASIPGTYPNTGMKKLQEIFAEAMQRGVVIEQEPDTETLNRIKERMSKFDNLIDRIKKA